MNWKTINEKLNLSSVFEAETVPEVTGAYSGDLLSDIMSHAKENEILITIQAHKNTLAVATLKDLPVIIICNNRPIPDDMIEAAKEEQISIYTTKKTPFQISGELFQLLNL